MKIDVHVPAIVLGMSVNGLGTVRSLARVGITVLALDPDRNRIGMQTRFAECVVCPNIQKNPKEFHGFLIQLAHRYKSKAVLIPTSDVYVEYLNQKRESLKPYFRYVQTDKPIMDKLMNKNGQYDLAKSHDILAPKTIYPRSISDLRQVTDQINFPVIIKGANTEQWRQKFQEKKAIVADTPEHLLKHYEQIQSEFGINPVIQEIIPGDDKQHFKICLYMDSKGNPILSFMLQKLRQYPCHFGIGSSVISVSDPELAELGIKFFKRIGYRGVGSIEFKKDLRDNKYKMIEVNPRLWAQNNLAAACGQNFALIYYLDSLGEKIKPQIMFKKGVKWISFRSDRASFYGYKKEGKIGWIKWLKDLLTGRRVWAYWAWDDPMPFFNSIDFGIAPIQKILNRMNILKNTKRNENNSHVNITTEVISDFDTFMSLRPAWNKVLEESKINNPFLRHEWLTAWWKGYGSNKKLFIIQFNENGLPVGFAPLMEYETKLTGMRFKAVGFISNHWTRMNFIFSRHPEECLKKLIGVLIKTKLPVILAQMNTESMEYQGLKEALTKTASRHAVTPKLHAYIPVEGGWDEYFNRQSYNFRMDSRRKFRRLNKKGEVTLIRNVGENGWALDKMLSVAQRSWQTKDNVSIVTTENGRRFYEEILKEWQGNKKIDFSILEIDGTPISYLVGIQNQGCFFAFDTAYDKTYQKYSPGMVMHNLLLKNLFDEGIKRFDFGYIASYKKRWSEEKIPMVDVTIFPSNAIGLALQTANYLKNKLKKDQIT